MQNLLTYLVVGALLSFALTKVNKFLGTIITFLLSGYGLYLFWNAQPSNFELLGLTTLEITPIAKFFGIVSLISFTLVSMFNLEWIKKAKYPSVYNLLFLLTLAGTIGVFMSKDLITLYIFWEITVFSSLFIVPMGKPESKKAAIWYVVISSLGSFLYLYGSFLAYSKFDTFDIAEIANALPNASIGFRWAILVLLISSAIAKSGVFPLHVWLRNVHGNAPDTFSAILSGQLVKMGSYLAVLIVSVFPVAALFQTFYQDFNILSYLLIWLGNISILIGTLMAIKQNDMKMLIAYSTVANSGYILIGVALLDQIGYAGALFHVLNHMLSATVIFLSFAAVVYRAGTTKIDEMGGLIWRMPWTFVAYLVGIISLAGIPPTSGFISKWMIFNALVRRGMFVTEMFVFLGSIGSFLYVFRPLAGVFLGQLKSQHKDIKEVPLVMVIPMLLGVLLMVLWGVFPASALNLIVDVQNQFNIKPFEFEGTVLKTPLGYWDTWIVFLVFAGGFVLACIIYFLTPKAKKIPLTNQYTAGEFLHNYDKYHYANDFYKFIEREYENAPSFEKLYLSFVNVLKEIGRFFNWIAETSSSAYVFWFAVLVLIVFLVRW